MREELWPIPGASGRRGGGGGEEQGEAGEGDGGGSPVRAVEEMGRREEWPLRV